MTFDLCLFHYLVLALFCGGESAVPLGKADPSKRPVGKWGARTGGPRTGGPRTSWLPMDGRTEKRLAGRLVTGRGTGEGREEERSPRSRVKGPGPVFLLEGPLRGETQDVKGSNETAPRHPWATKDSLVWDAHAAGTPAPARGAG